MFALSVLAHTDRYKTEGAKLQENASFIIVNMCKSHR